LSIQGKNDEVIGSAIMAVIYLFDHSQICQYIFEERKHRKDKDGLNVKEFK